MGSETSVQQKSEITKREEKNEDRTIGGDLYTFYFIFPYSFSLSSVEF
jgi:hypothetical protein